MKSFLFVLINFIAYIISLDILSKLTLKVNPKKPNPLEIFVAVIIPFILLYCCFIISYSALFL